MMKTYKIISTLLSCLLFFSIGCEKEELRTEDLSNKSNLANLDKKALPHTKKYGADVATDWFSLLTDISKKTPYFNPQSIRILSYSGIALYESVVPGMPSYQSMYTHLTGESINFEKKKDYYWPAVANAAIARISTKIMADYPQPHDLAAMQQLELDFNDSFSASISPEQLEFSIEFGRYVADKIYTWSRSDGTFNAVGNLALCPLYTPLGGPGNWVPTPPRYFPAAGACQGLLRTFIPEIVVTARPSAPPSYSTDPSSDFYKMNEKVYELTLDLTPKDLVNNEAWRDIFITNYNVPTHMFKLTSDIIAKENLNLEDASVIFAKEGMAMSDAIVTNFAAKFHYSLLRPVTYIRDVLGYSEWIGIYPAPQHPSYPAVSPSAVGAAVTVLEGYFGTNYHFQDSTQEPLYGIWSYNSFDELLQNVGRSRTHSGINYQFSVDAGYNLGRNVGERIDAMPFKK